MKTPQYILVLFISILSSALYGQSQVSPNQIVGTWTLDFQASKNSMNAPSIAKWNKIPEERRNHIKKSYQGRQLELRADGTYILTLTDGRTRVSNWAYNANTKTIEIVHNNNKVSHQSLKSLKGKKMVLIPITKSKRAALVPELHYVKK